MWSKNSNQKESIFSVQCSIIIDDDCIVLKYLKEALYQIAL